MHADLYGKTDGLVALKIEQGKTNFKELERYALKKGEPKRYSGRQELLENVVNQYMFA